MARLRRTILAAASTLPLIVGLIAVAPAQAAELSASTAPAAATTTRSFSCSGNAGDLFTAFTVTGKFNDRSRPYAVTVTSVRTGTAVSTLSGRARPVGASTVHPGYVTWDITGASAAGDLYQLNVSPVLPGGGGSFNADLEVLYAGGVNGSIVATMVNCTVTGPAMPLSRTRTFSCAGTPAEPTTKRTVTGVLDRRHRPSSVVVSDSTGAVVSRLAGDGHTRRGLLATPRVRPVGDHRCGRGSGPLLAAHPAGPSGSRRLLRRPTGDRP